MRDGFAEIVVRLNTDVDKQFNEKSPGFNPGLFLFIVFV